ncbi:hypothetical protein PIB30_090891 [Stylosanthes scabra]|uniref:Uncharacterized protein n=1 Tax=Stylosanthes scabra TaxID=79078 RepID=A0ABU6VU92_9FABA|nr:hypothetical protein [Stylosanthes scabra]
MKISTSRSYINRGQHPLKKHSVRDPGGRWKKPHLTTKGPAKEKGVDQGNQTIQQLEAALKELLERQTREDAIAMEAVKRAGELARKQQAILDEAEKREKDREEKLNSKIPTPVDNDNKTMESKDYRHYKIFSYFRRIFRRIITRRKYPRRKIFSVGFSCPTENLRRMNPTETGFSTMKWVLSFPADFIRRKFFPTINPTEIGIRYFPRKIRRKW